MDLTRKPYEISLWEDVLIWVGESGEEYFDVTEMKEPVAYQYYKEIKLCTIGSDSMQSQNRAVNAKFAQKINGENSLTFTVYYRYVDNITGEKIENPYIPYLISERKVKLKYDGEWFDFIIKNIQENSESKAFTYTCKDLFVTELSKTGFEIELDNELENNMGTIDFLANKILEDSDWSVEEGEAPLKQYIEEPLYEITTNTALTITNIEDENATKELTKGEHIYVFYSNINDKKPVLQLLYEKDDLFETNDDLVINKKHTNYTCTGFDGDKWPDFIGINDLGKHLVTLSKLRGNRLVKQAKSKYDATIDKYVSVYNNGEVYGFTETEYITSGGVVNYVANPSNFTSTSGWQTDANQLDYKLTTNKNAEGLFGSYIEVDFSNKQGALVMNAGIGGNRSTIKSFVEGQKYVLRMKYKTNDKTGGYATDAPTAKICEYHMDNSRYVISKTEDDKDIYNIFTFGNYKGPALTNQQEEKADKSYGYLDVEDRDYIYMEATCARTVSETELKDWDFKVGLFFDFNTTSTIYIEDVQVFPYQTYEDGGLRLCIPGGKVHSEIKTKYIYYKPDSTWQSIADLIPVSEGYAENPAYELFYESGSQFTKVRSISAKESNRFNLLQNLCETFQAWLKIKVAHNDDGTLTLDEETHRPIKTVSFVEEIGEYNPAGFRYGVNSKSIQRTVDSASIVSKLIVKDNSNEFAPNGFCSIARATENPTGENFLLSFDHYIRQGLLDGDVVTNDLYLTSDGYLGYYTQLKELNANRNEKIDLQAGCLTDIMNYEASYTTYKTSYDSAIEEQLVIEQDFCKLLGRDIPHDQFGNSKDHETKPGADGLSEGRDDLNKYWVKWCQCENIINQHGTLYALAKNNLDAKQAEYDGYVEDLKELKTQKLDLWKEFYKKYSRFIQEGSWIKEDYTDPNLYYMDAESTLYTSTQPKVTYNISVIDVSPLPGYETYDFKLGDISYVEDPEFFGYSRKPGAAPYREEIVVSEITLELDSPEKTQIKVQNYKTQFEDLFQRITAQTQQAEYHTGEYARAASIVEADGTISTSTLENSFANNSFRLSNARDQSVIWDSSGITTSSLSNPSEMVRIISGGIFLSTDGGESWKTGITGSGINTSYLTAGQINTNNIYIMNGNDAAFRWDAEGLNAFYRQDGNSYNTKKYVRFNQFGIYGAIDGEDKDFSSEEGIRNNAAFALTWNGFSLKNADGSVNISTNNDIQVLQKIEEEDSTATATIERIKIGRLGNEAYGIRISKPVWKDDAWTSTPVMETSDNGELWLRDSLSIGSETDETSVAIGNLNGGLVINANNKFQVSKTGQVLATDANISGTITATEGSIGGLKIIGNAFCVTKDGNDRTVLQIEDGGLKIFGQINASDGGNIGGFLVENGKLISTDTFEGQSSPALELDGTNGAIYAQSITLGTNAKIENYIELGNAYIHNPTEDNGHKLIESQNLLIYDNGKASFGEINVDGSRSTISGDNWSIDNNYARFDNVNVSGTIETSVFKTNSTQAAGGAMIFRPSYKASLLDYSKASEQDLGQALVQLEEDYLGQIQSQVWIVDSNGAHYAGKICDYDNLSKTLIVECVLTNTNIKSLIDLGRYQDFYQTYDSGFVNGKTYYTQKNLDDAIIYNKNHLFEYNDGNVNILGSLEDGLLEITDSTYEFSEGLYGYIVDGKYEFSQSEALIGINSGNAPVGDGLIYPCGLTVTTLGAKEPNLFLGDLSKLGKSEYTGHGLYADNVYLNGSLVTKSKGCYAGINTISNVVSKKEKVGTESNIIFWAGAKSTDAADIKDSLFQVTENGYVYVENSIFAGGSITGTDIRAARIHGTGPGLQIYDADKGICFYKSFDESTKSGTEVFTVGTNGLATNGDYFVSITEGKVSFKTHGNENYLSLKKIEEEKGKEVPVLYHYHSDSKQCGLRFDEGTTSFFFTTKENTQTSLTISSNLVSIKQMMELSKDDKVKMQYKPVNNGYDLYVVG